MTRHQTFALALIAVIVWTALLFCAAVLVTGCGAASDVGSAEHEEPPAPERSPEGWCCGYGLTPGDSLCDLTGSQADALMSVRPGISCECWGVVRSSAKSLSGECIDE